MSLVLYEYTSYYIVLACVCFSLVFVFLSFVFPPKKINIWIVFLMVLSTALQMYQENWSKE